MSPDQLLMFGVYLLDVLIVRFRANVDSGDTALHHFDETSRDVAALAFRLENHAAAMRGT